MLKSLSFLFLAILLSGSNAYGATSIPEQADQTTASREELSAKSGWAGEYLRIGIRYKGAYRITGRELQQAGVRLADVQPAKLGLWNNGQAVPLLVNSKDPKQLGQDDTLEFIGSYPQGTYSTFKPDNTYNVYFLSWTAASPLQYRSESIDAPLTSTTAVFHESRHLERDYYFRSSALAPGTTDNFYWFHFNAGGADTFPVKIDFPGFASELNEPVKLTFRIFGFSDAPSVKPGHKFMVKYANPAKTEDAYNLGSFEFDGKRNFDYVTSLPVTQVRQNYRILLDTPANRRDAVDAISLDWIKADYPRRVDAEGQDLFYFNSSFTTAPISGLSYVANAPPATRVFAPELAKVFGTGKGDGAAAYRIADQPTTYVAVSPNGFLPVEQLSMRRSRNLADEVPKTNEVLVLCHTAVAESAKAFAQYRASTGLPAHVVNVEDLYDSTNNGLISDVVIKRYIRYVAAHTQLKYIVLWGDSTTDYRQANFEETSQTRVLIPIHWISNPATTWTKGFVDDNWYASFYYANTPDVALGRIPVTSDDVGYEYLRKVIEYEQLGASAKDKALLLSSVEASFQDLANETLKSFSDKFSTATVLFPDTKTAALEVKRLEDEFNAGIQLLYYIGHGGAAVWRVGPTDFTKQKDLFTPKDVERLRNRAHYPIIAASSCYTTSFDYTYSLGEALVLQPAAGAIAIVGTPWKSTVYEDHMFNKRFFEEYFRPENDRLGDAFLRTKRHFAPADRNQVDAQTFTLLGDPCLHMKRSTK